MFCPVSRTDGGKENGCLKVALSANATNANVGQSCWLLRSPEKTPTV